MRKLAVGLALVAGVLVAAYLVLTSEWFWRRRITAFVSGDTLTLDVGHARVRGGTLYATNLVANWGSEGDRLRVRATIAGAQIDPAWGQLLLGRVRFEKIEVLDPQVTVLDDDAGRPTPPSHGSFSRPAVEVDEVHVDGGTFTFVRLRKSTRAVLMVRKIEGKVAAFGTTHARRDEAVRAELTAQLGFSGRTHLELTARPRDEVPSADIDLRVENQDLRDLGAFFEPNAGVAVRGRLIEGFATAKMRGDRLVTTLRTRFDGLVVHVGRTTERGAFAAALTNLGIGVGLDRRNVDRPAAQRAFTAVTRRAADDTVLSFFMRGLRDAALGAAKKPYAR